MRDLSHTRCAQAVEGLQESIESLRRVEHVGAEDEVEGPFRSGAAQVILVAPAETAHLSACDGGTHIPWALGESSNRRAHGFYCGCGLRSSAKKNARRTRLSSELQ